MTKPRRSKQQKASSISSSSSSSSSYSAAAVASSSNGRVRVKKGPPASFKVDRTRNAHLSFNSILELTGHLMEEISCIQAIDTSPWFVFQKGLRINKAILKNDAGELEIQPQFANQVLNIEDVRHHLELYNNLVGTHPHHVHFVIHF
jgi:hypothetical protein